MPFLADDRHLPGLGDEQLPQLLELGRGGVPPGEDPEVHADLEPGGLLLDSEGDDVLDLH